MSVFDEVRHLVSAREVVELNGLHPNRSGYICCPLHHEKTASMKLYPNGSWYCFGCNRGGSSIDLVVALYDLTPIDAARKINTDFHLGLDLERRDLTPQEQERIQRRQQTTDTYKLFEQWRSDTIRILNQCFREAHFALKSLETPADLDQLTDAHAFAIREQAHVEWLADTLTSGTMAEQMQIFRERGKIGQLCNRILSNTPMKSGVA